MGGVWHQAGCCCARGPCGLCDGVQPAAVVSLGGTCGDADQQEAVGTYDYLDFGEDPGGAYCWWRWDHTSTHYYWVLLVVYCKADDSYCARLYQGPARSFGVGKADCPCANDYWGALTDVGPEGGNLACTGGTLTGGFWIYGDPLGWETCRAEVSLG